MEDAHAREVEDVLSFFGTDVHTGLTDFEVSKASAGPRSCQGMLQTFWLQLYGCMYGQQPPLGLIP